MKEITNKESFCVAAATKVLGDKWTPKILVALMGGSKHFCELQNLTFGINPRTLSSRLKKLCSFGVIEKHLCDDCPSKAEYSLSKKGIDLVPILTDMYHWGKKYHNPSSN